MAASPVLVEYSEAVGRAGARTVRAPILHALALIMVARGADRVIVATPGEEEKDRVGDAINDLPPERRNVIQLVDTNGGTLDRIRSYLAPLRKQAVGWPEAAFVSSAEMLLYQAALAQKEQAMVLDDSVQQVRDLVPRIDARAFKGEAAFRLADIIALVAGYEPTLADEGSASGIVEVATTGKTVESLLHSSEFHALAAAAGGLGFAANPQVALKELGNRFKALLARKAAGQVLALARTAADLSGAAPAGEATSRLFAALEVPEGSNGSFRPPFFDLGSAQLGLYRAALFSRHPEATPPEGAIMVFEHFRQGRCGTRWLNTGEEDTFDRIAASIHRRVQQAAATRGAYQSFLA